MALMNKWHGAKTGDWCIGYWCIGETHLRPMFLPCARCISRVELWQGGQAENKVRRSFLSERGKVRS